MACVSAPRLAQHAALLVAAFALTTAVHERLALADESTSASVPPTAPPSDVNSATAASGALSDPATTATGNTPADPAAAPPDSGSEVIEVRAHRPTVRDATAVVAEDISMQAGANNDVLRALAAGPAVARMPFSFGGIALRGASLRHTAVQIDDVPVPLPFHFGGVTSIMPTPALRHATMYPGNFPIQYGRAAGGFVAVESRTPTAERVQFGFDVSPLQLALWSQGPLHKPAKSAATAIHDWGYWAGVRRSYIDTLLRPFVKSSTPLPAYLDGQLLVSSGDPKSWGTLRPIVLVSHDNTISPDLTLTLGFWRAAAPWRYTTPRASVSVMPWLGQTNLFFAGDMTPDNMVNKLQVTRDLDQAGSVFKTSRYWSHLELQLGTDFLINRLNGENNSETGGRIASLQERWLHAGAWTSIIGNYDKFGFDVGARYDRFGLANSNVASVRGNAHVTPVDGVELRVGAGTFNEPPQAADLGSTGGTVPQGAEAVQLSAGLRIDRQITRHALRLESTGYFNRAENLPVITDQNVFTTITRNSFSPVVLEVVQQYLGEGTPRAAIGRGRSYGVESSLQWLFATQRVALAYTWSRSLRTEDPRFFVGWHPYALDQPHRVHVAWGYTGTKWNFGAAVHYATGIPYSPVRLDGQGNVQQDLWSARLPDFFQIDARIDRHWRKAHGTWAVYLDVQNATARSNIESIRENVEVVDAQNVLTRSRISGLPILPMLGVQYVPR